jgi:hypothetical protein
VDEYGLYVVLYANKFVAENSLRRAGRITDRGVRERERDRIRLYSLPTPSIREVRYYVNVVTPSATVHLVIDFYPATIWGCSVPAPMFRITAQ